MERKTVTVEQAAQILGIGRMTAYNAVGRGEIPSIRIGQRILIPKAALDEMLNVSAPGPANAVIEELIALGRERDSRISEVR